MGIDLYKRGRVPNRRKVNSKSQNLYYALLVKLFTFLTRRTESAFAKTVLRRLVSSRTTRCPVALSRLSRHMAKNQDKIAVVVATVTDDKRLIVMPKLTVCALKFTETARARIVKAGGKCLTLD